MMAGLSHGGSWPVGESYVTAAYRGQAYRHAIWAYVRLLNANGLDVILDLHWTDSACPGIGYRVAGMQSLVSACWNSQIAPVMASYPVIAGEIGEGDCAHGYIDALMAWMDARHASYLAWTWDDWPGACGSGPALITSYAGTPTPYGAGYRAHLRTLSKSGQ